MSEAHEHPLNRIGGLLSSQDCADCIELQKHGGGLCPNCEETFDLHETAAPADTGNDHPRYLRLQAALAALEGGYGSAEDALEVIRPVPGDTRRLAAGMVATLTNGPLEDRYRDVYARIIAHLDRLEQAATAFIGCLQEGDIPRARKDLPCLRLLYKERVSLRRELLALIEAEEK